jgi:hypothetical protein
MGHWLSLNLQIVLTQGAEIRGKGKENIIFVVLGAFCSWVILHNMEGAQL